MLKPVLKLAAVGFLGLALWKVLPILLLPLLGIFLTVVKIALVVGLVFLVVWWLRKSKDGEAPAK